MARSRRVSVPQEIDSTAPVNDTDDTTKEIDMDENTATTDAPEETAENTAGEVTEETLAESVTDNDTGASDSESDGASDAEESEMTPAPFEIPADPTDLELGDEVATMAGMRMLKLRQQVLKIDATLRTVDDANSEAAIIVGAESDDAPDNVKALLAAFREAEENMKKALAELTTGVKEARGDVTLSEEDKENLRTERAQKAKMFATSSKFLREMLDNNEVPDDVARFLDTVEIPGARKSGSRGNTGNSNYQATTAARPRLGDDGYISISGTDVKYTKFSDAARALKPLGVRDVTVGALHDLWAKHGEFENITNWTSAPPVTEFTVGSGSNERQITIVFAYTGANN